MTMTTAVIDARWNGNARTGNDFSKGAVGLTRAWRGYLLCAYLDNDPHANDLWATIYVPYVPAGWHGSSRITGADGTTLRAAGPPAVAYRDLWTVIAYVPVGGSGLATATMPYPRQADAPDDYRRVAFGPSSPTPLPQVNTAVRPALAPFGAGFALAAVDPADGLWVLTGRLDLASGAIAWDGGAAAVPVRTGMAPALCVYQGQLVCAALQPGGGVVVTTSADGRTWSAPVVTPYQSGLGPGLCAGPAGDSLELVFADPVTRHVYTGSSTDGKTWAPARQHPDGITSQSPALVASAAGVLCAVYVGAGGQTLWYTTTKPGVYPLT